MKAKSLSNGWPPESRVPQKWRWHYRALQRLREHVMDDLCAKLAQAAKPIEPPSMDAADSATDESDRALALSLLSGEEDVLHEVDSALRRILNGTYGICEKSGEPIPPQRLRAVPWTRFTKEAEDAIEKERRNGGAGRTAERSHQTRRDRPAPRRTALRRKPSR